MAGYPDHLIIAQIAFDFTHDHRHRIGGKAHFMLQIKIVDGLHKPDAANLKQIIHIFTAIGKALHNGQHQLQISIDQCFLGTFIALLELHKQLLHFCICQDL